MVKKEKEDDFVIDMMKTSVVLTVMSKLKDILFETVRNTQSFLIIYFISEIDKTVSIHKTKI